MESIYNDVYAEGLKCVKITEMFLFESNQIQNRKYVHVIDGQQRLISFSILYACIHFFLEDLKKSVNDKRVTEMVDVRLEILRARLQSKDEERISLILKKGKIIVDVIKKAQDFSFRTSERVFVVQIGSMGSR